MPIETQNAADELAAILEDANVTLADIESYLQQNHRQHILEAHS